MKSKLEGLSNEIDRLGFRGIGEIARAVEARVAGSGARVGEEGALTELNRSLIKGILGIYGLAPLSLQLQSLLALPDFSQQTMDRLGLRIVMALRKSKMSFLLKYLTNDCLDQVKAILVLARKIKTVENSKIEETINKLDQGEIDFSLLSYEDINEIFRSFSFKPNSQVSESYKKGLLLLGLIKSIEKEPEEGDKYCELAFKQKFLLLCFHFGEIEIINWMILKNKGNQGVFGDLVMSLPRAFFTEGFGRRKTLKYSLGEYIKFSEVISSYHKILKRCGLQPWIDENMTYIFSRMERERLRIGGSETFNLTRCLGSHSTKTSFAQQLEEAMAAQENGPGAGAGV